MNRTEKIKFAIECVKRTKGDDYYCAKNAFKNKSKEEMHQLYGQSGQTCQEILDGYQSREDEHNEVITFLEGEIR